MTISDYLSPERWLNPTAGPLYVQLRKRIEAAIASGLLPPESALPPEREIATVTELSRVTVRKAMSELAEQGIVVQRQGHGSFVAPLKARVEQPLSQLTSFTEDMAQRGMVAASQWLERGLFLPTPDESATLALGPGEEVARLARLRTADGRPMAIERASLPVTILPNPLLVMGSLYDVLGQSGLRPVRAVQRISAINLGAEDADLLELPVQAAGLRIARVSTLADGRVVEFTRSIYRGDAYQFVAELHPISGRERL
jgi:GntR family transcriptional regulator